MSVLFCIFLMCLENVCSVIFSDDDYKKLPPIYDMDSYSKCKQDNNIFCNIKFKLKPNNPNNTLWQLIEVAKTDPRYYFHDIIYRGRCISTSLYEKPDGMLQTVVQLENVNLNNVSLNVYVDNMNCLNSIRLSNYDYMVVILFIGYFLSIVYASILDFSMRKNNKYADFPKRRLTYVKSLSVLSNWKKLRRPINKLDYAKLKSFQGIKTYNMILVITGHTILNGVVTFINNTKYVEDFYANSIKRGFANFCLHLVQTYFVFSAWLLTIQVHDSVEKNKKLEFRDVIKGIVFRYLRLIPTLLFIISVHKSSWIVTILDGPQTDMIAIDHKACQKNWWFNIFFLNNFLYAGDMCNFGTWYLANDFQMFVISLLMFYVMFRLKIDVKIFGGMFIVSWLILAYIIYKENFEVIFNITPENAKVENAFRSYSLYTLYTSLHANCGSYVIGIIFGTIYYKCRNVTIENVHVVMTAFWALGFFGLPLLAVKLSLYEYSPIITAVIGASLKPLFSLGIAIGVLGMSFNIGGFVKKICEWDVAVFIGKWTYCTYLFHFGITFSTYVLSETLLEISDYVLIKNTMYNVLSSFSVGFVMYLLLELPLANIVNNIVRQEKKLV